MPPLLCRISQGTGRIRCRSLVKKNKTDSTRNAMKIIIPTQRRHAWRLYNGCISDALSVRYRQGRTLSLRLHLTSSHSHSVSSLIPKRRESSILLPFRGSSRINRIANSKFVIFGTTHFFHTKSPFFTLQSFPKNPAHSTAS